MGVYFTALESLFPPLMGLDNAALRSSCSSSSKNPCEGPGWWEFNSGSWFRVFFLEITTALDEWVVRLAENAVIDEAVRGIEDFLAPAASATWPKKQCYKAL